MTTRTPKEPMNVSDPVADFFARERAAVTVAPADDLRWERIVEEGSRTTRSRSWLLLGAAAAVLALAIGAGALVERPSATRAPHLPAATQPATRHTTSPSPSVTSPEPSTSASQAPPAPVPPSFTVLSVTTARAGRLVALGRATCQAGSCATLALSTDDGAHWTLLHTFPTAGASGVQPSGSSAAVAGAGIVSQVRFASASVGWVFGGAILQTTDGGATWHAYPHPGGDVLALETDGRDVVLTAGGTCDTSTCRGPVTVVRAPISAQSATDAAGVIAGSGVTGAAITWHQGHAYVSPAVASTAGQSPPSPVELRTDGLHAVGAATCGNGLGGTQLVGPAAGTVLFAVCPNGGAMGHFGYAVLSSSDAGATWRPVSSDALLLVNAGSAAFAAADAQSLLAVSGGSPDLHGSMARSVDGGRTWTSPSQPPPLPDRGWAWVGAPGGPSFYAISAGPTPSLWRSTDRGQTWSAVRIAGS
ncbi:sialidase family protein [Pedococcus sp.]|uniref:WD40/YVTN/BNR-like repeat-containing protein n=1 Tax=Pedococcus sp. TaxID=2860345 RepID=UPI002E150007|nr:sialidase family protein [Pedococcus sp.]